MNMVYYCSLRLIIFLVKCIHTGVKKQMKILENGNNWKPGLFGDLYYTLHSCPFF